MSGNYYDKLLKTAETAGINILSNEKCCKLLAFLYCCGSDNQDVLYNTRLRKNIYYTQRKINVFGGENPKKDLMFKFNEYVKDELKCQLEGNHSSWIKSIAK